MNARAASDALAALVAALDRHPRVAIAVSGGVDSMTLAHVAQRFARAPATMVHACGPAGLAAARARVEALARAAELAASQRTRDVTLGVQAERAPSYGGNVFGLSATIPLFVNNDYSGDVARA